VYLESVASKWCLTLACAGFLQAQEPVVDRSLAGGEKPVSLEIERDAKSFLGDSFKVGATGEAWIIDTIRVWALPNSQPGCPSSPGDRLAGITLLGALDNPPVPGVPTCDCHALVTIASAPLIAGTASSSNANVKLAVGDHIWQIDFRNLHWSLPGGTDVLFAVRATDRNQASCSAAAHWSLSASTQAGHRLKAFDTGANPLDTAGGATPALVINMRVWAHRAPQ
jgi:hypothetical protein